MNKLNCIRTKKAIRHKTIEYRRPNFTDITPDAIGRDLVLSTLLSKSLSNTSLIIHPADLINTDPKKNNKRYLMNIWISLEKSNPIVSPHKHGQNNSMNPIGFFKRVNSIK